MPETFELDLQVPASCFGFIRSELEPYGITPPKDTLLKLSLQAGTDGNGKKIHRPYVLMADILDRANNGSHPISGKAGVLRDPDKAVAAWRQDQANTDAALGLSVPAEALQGRMSKGSFTVGSFPKYD